MKAAELEFAMRSPDFDLDTWREQLNPKPAPSTAVAKKREPTLVQVWKEYAADNRRPQIEAEYLEPPLSLTLGKSLPA